MYVAIVCETGCAVINFETNPIFLIKSFFYMTKTLRQKFKYLEKKKELLKRNNNQIITNFLKVFQLPKIVSDMGVRL